MKVYGLIMAGGGGTRFWPLSRQKTPKQLLNLSGKDAMINEAAARLYPLVDKQDLFVITNAAQAEALKAVTAGKVLPENVIAEPAARNTAACICYAAALLYKKFGDGVMVVTPSDAYIRDEAAFTDALRAAVGKAEESGGVVTVGIAPTFPATGYGYVRVGEGEGKVKPALQFVEKPNLEKAKEYLLTGEYLWNSGMFVWKISAVLEKFKRFLPELYAGVEDILSHLGQADEQAVLQERYPVLPAISVDYGIVEKAEDVFVVPGSFGWSDVGSWDMLGAVHPADGENNVRVGQTLALETSGSVLYAADKLVAVVGVENLVVVETKDAVMVCPKDRVQDVKKIVEELKRQGREDLL